jgi:DNA-binding transcriptional regulator GbsR (MarR family)
VLRKGERREYFEAEKDIWKMFCIIARERKRREIAPAMEVLKGCAARTRGLKSAEARAFHEQMQSLHEFLRLGERVLDHIANSEQSRIMKLAAKMIQ